MALRQAGRGWSTGTHSSHPPNVALLSFVVQGVLHPPCWDLEFSHSYSFFFAASHSLWDLSSPTRYGTQVPSSQRAES